MNTNSRLLIVVALVLGMTGCGNGSLQSEAISNTQIADLQQPPVVLTSRDQLDAHVGQLVTLRGEVSNTKIPEILGVDVQSNHPDLRGQYAEATGVLHRYVVTPDEIEAANFANRGAGVFYRLKDPDSAYEASVRPVSP